MRRTLTRLVTGCAAALLATVTVTVPGSAAPAVVPGLTLQYPDVVVTQVPKENQLYAWVDVPGRAPAHAARITVTVDVSGIADVADAQVADEGSASGDNVCDRTGGVVVCTITEPAHYRPGLNLSRLAGITLNARPDVPQGATGTLRYTAQLDGGAPASTESTVSVGTGTYLSGTIASGEVSAPGRTVATRLPVTNQGSRPVPRVALIVENPAPRLRADGGAANCTYGVVTICTFDDELTPGPTYEVTPPLRLKLPAGVAAGSTAVVTGIWYTPAELRQLLAAVPGAEARARGPQGTGPAVRLRPTTGAPDGRHIDNSVRSWVTVTGDTRRDTAAVGATVTAGVGETAQVRLGYANRGPGALYHGDFAGADPATHIVLPVGLRVVAADDACVPLPPEGNGPPEYLCVRTTGVTRAKASALFDFTVEVGADAAAASPGAVRLNGDRFVGETLIDSRPGDDTAAIRVRPGGSAPPTPRDTALGDSPTVTRTRTVLAGTAALALLTGGVLLLIRRRRPGS